MSTGKITMRRKPLKIALISIVSLLAIIAVAISVILFFGDRFGLHRVNASQVRTMDFSNEQMYPQGFATDALHLVRLIEENHPIFVIDNWLPGDYEVIRDEFLAYASNENITRTDFIFAIMKYITTLRDGHMNLLWSVESNELDVNWREQNGNLFLVDKSGSITTAEVVEIGGVPVSQIFSVIDRYYYSENEAARHNSRSLFSRLSIVVDRAGGIITDNGIQIILKDNGEIITKDVMFLDQTQSREREFIIRHEMINDVFLIDLRIFSPDESLTETVQSIEAAVADGTRKFIVDLRGNGGGNSWVGERLLNAMGIAIPQFGALIRTSPVEIEQGMWHFRILNFLGIDYITMSPSTGSSNPNNVFVSVLTDAASFSSAMWMATWTQDGNFGNVIGSPSSNAPTSFGNVIRHTLPYSEISLPISRTQWLRPDENADQLILMPDILVDPNDALDVALEYLRNLGN